MTKPDGDLHRVMAEVRANREKHGHSREGDRAHLREMLARDDLPSFLRRNMQLALQRHVMQDQIDRHENAERADGQAR